MRPSRYNSSQFTDDIAQERYANRINQIITKEASTDRYPFSHYSPHRSKTPNKGPMLKKLDVYLKYQHSLYVIEKLMQKTCSKFLMLAMIKLRQHHKLSRKIYKFVPKVMFSIPTQQKNYRPLCLRLSNLFKARYQETFQKISSVKHCGKINTTKILLKNHKSIVQTLHRVQLSNKRKFIQSLKRIQIKINTFQYIKKFQIFTINLQQFKSKIKKVCFEKMKISHLQNIIIPKESSSFMKENYNLKLKQQKSRYLFILKTCCRILRQNNYQNILYSFNKIMSYNQICRYKQNQKKRNINERMVISFFPMLCTTLQIKYLMHLDSVFQKLRGNFRQRNIKIKKFQRIVSLKKKLIVCSGFLQILDYNHQRSKAHFLQVESSRIKKIEKKNQIITVTSSLGKLFKVLNIKSLNQTEHFFSRFIHKYHKNHNKFSKFLTILKKYQHFQPFKKIQLQSQSTILQLTKSIQKKLNLQKTISHIQFRNFHYSFLLIKCSAYSRRQFQAYQQVCCRRLIKTLSFICQKKKLMEAFHEIRHITPTENPRPQLSDDHQMTLEEINKFLEQRTIKFDDSIEAFNILKSDRFPDHFRLKPKPVLIDPQLIN